MIGFDNPEVTPCGSQGVMIQKYFKHLKKYFLHNTN